MIWFWFLVVAPVVAGAFYGLLMLLTLAAERSFVRSEMAWQAKCENDE